LIRGVIGERGYATVTIRDRLNCAGRIVVKRRRNRRVAVLWHRIGEHPVQGIERLGFMGAIRTIDLVDVIGGIIMPRGSVLHIYAVGLGGGHLTVACVVGVVRLVDEGISYPSQVAHVIVVEAGGGRSDCGGCFSEVLIIIICRNNTGWRSDRVRIIRRMETPIGTITVSWLVGVCGRFVEWVRCGQQSIVLVIGVASGLA
jgi:hypothetical protein